MVTDVRTVSQAHGNAASIAQVESWHDQHAADLFDLAHRMLGDEAGAQAVVIEVFVLAQHTGGQWSGRQCGQRLRRLTQRLAGAALRQRRTARTARPVEPSREVHWPLSELPVMQRDVVGLAYFDGYTVDELAVRFELPRRVVITSLRDGMVELDRLLVADGPAVS